MNSTYKFTVRGTYTKKGSKKPVDVLIHVHAAPTAAAAVAQFKRVWPWESDVTATLGFAKPADGKHAIELHPDGTLAISKEARDALDALYQADAAKQKAERARDQATGKSYVCRPCQGTFKTGEGRPNPSMNGFGICHSCSAAAAAPALAA